MSSVLSGYWLLAAALWYFINGLLHDIFVLKQHKGGYDRELLRLLMDGHVLILSGLLIGVAYFMLPHDTKYGAIIGLIVTAFMLVYCAMIFPFLKSIGTIAVSAITLAACIRLLITSGLT